MEQQQLFIQMALNAWNGQITRATKFFEAHSDEDLLKEIAPGKNRIVYILGHLIAVHDGMIGLFGAGERSFAHLDDAFIKNPDKSGLAIPTVSELRDDWKKCNETLTRYFNQMSPDDWFAKHTAVSEEDFAKEPTRNKLNVLLSRTSHVAYHLGQLALTK